MTTLPAILATYRSAQRALLDYRIEQFPEGTRVSISATRAGTVVGSVYAPPEYLCVRLDGANHWDWFKIENVERV